MVQKNLTCPMGTGSPSSVRLYPSRTLERPFPPLWLLLHVIRSSHYGPRLLLLQLAELADKRSRCSYRLTFFRFKKENIKHITANGLPLTSTLFDEFVVFHIVSIMRLLRRRSGNTLQDCDFVKIELSTICLQCAFRQIQFRTKCRDIGGSREEK